MYSSNSRHKPRKLTAIIIMLSQLVFLILVLFFATGHFQVASSLANGSIEDNANFPWVVTLGGCHGTLIAPQWVLTAAHCKADTGSMPDARYTRTNPNTGITTTGLVHSDGYTIHENYVQPTRENDIALVHLKTEFPPDPLLRPAELPLGSGFPGQTGVVASVGTYLGGPAVPLGKFSAYRDPITEPLGLHYFNLKSPTASLCNGDSGGGYILSGGGKNFVVGVLSASFNADCNPPLPNSESDAMDVFYYNDWIRSKTGIPKPGFLGPEDILFRHSTGNLSIWFTKGGTIVDQTQPTWYGNGQPPGNDFKIEGVKQLTGKPQADILWRHTSGALAIWEMYNGSRIRDTVPSWQSSGGAVGNDWQILGLGDFNGDRINDILWKHSSGALSIWFINNTGQFAGVWTPRSDSEGPNVDCFPPNLARYRFSGIGDFNGDQLSDILWRNGCGKLSIWMNKNFDGIFQRGSPGTVGTDWQIAATADFNNDWRSDILWRNTDGTVAVWLMNGWSAAGETAGRPPLEWQIQKVGDINGDRSADILWRHTSGTLSIWYMYGGLNYARTWPGAVDNGWTVISVAQFGRNH